LIIPGTERVRRRHSSPEDQRNPFQRDRDRILYSSAFRRLAGITQIARAGDADVFHTRLTHTLKVAQVGRRLAEFVISGQTAIALTLGVDAEVVEAACLAHDLGHPPFGHLGEETLNELVLLNGDEDGFEGNAQSLRILSKLAVRFTGYDGLDLTRATLAACIKYPWRRQANDPIKSRKWGYYGVDQAEFQFARNGSAAETKTAEAELMDWADDIAYSVHDIEDCHRCQLIPWRSIFCKDGRDKLVAAVTKGRTARRGERANLRAAHSHLVDFITGMVGEKLYEPYEATKEQRQIIRLVTSQLIGRYVTSVRLRVPRGDQSCLEIPDDIKSEIAILKQITREYIITIPALAGQQHGQRKLLTELFEDLLIPGSEKYLPRRIVHLLVAGPSRARRVADCIAGLTESETIALHHRLRGLEAGSVLDPILR
jgi:dGTPase